MQPLPSSPPPVIRPDWAVFLDVDGTLVSLAASPDAVRIRPETVPLLERLRAALDGAVALVSGRPADEVAGLFGSPAIPIAGLHGLERRDAGGRRHAAPEAPDLARARKMLATFVEGHPGTLLEDKGMTLALHYRAAPEAETEARRAMATLATECGPDVQVQEGKMVLELKSAHAHKGDAVRAFLAAPPFRGRRPAYVGDDATDEDAFRTVNADGGVSVRVGPAGPTEARAALADVDAVHDWLRRSLDALEHRA